MKKTLTLILTALFLAVAPQVAHAELGGGSELVQGSLDVEINGGGKVTGTGFDCPGDCSDDTSWPDTQPAKTVKLTAIDRNAWTFTGWTGCTSLPGDFRSCNATFGEPGTSVIANFRDDQSPSVFLTSPADGTVVGGSVLGDVNTYDNDATTRVQYLVDGDPASVRPPLASSWSADIATDQLAEGTHTIQARAWDATGNMSTTAARSFTVDHTAPTMAFADAPVATKAQSATFSFTVNEADFKEAGCVIEPEDINAGWEPCAPGVPFTREVPDEGSWKFVVRLTDNVGNELIAVRRFKVDRTAPDAGFNSGPADGATVDVGNVAYGWDVSDATVVTQACSWDGGQAEACDGTASRGLTKGPHRFNVTFTDQAGNESSLSRTVTVKVDGDLPDDPNDPNDPSDPNDPNDPDNPDTTDRTAPTVKLGTKNQKLRALKRGLKVKVECSEACSGTVAARGKSGVRFTGSVELTAAGRTVAVLKPNRKAKKALKASTKALKLKVTSTLADKAGNRTTTGLKARVRK